MKFEVYPQLTAELIENPRKFYAIPVIGFLTKCIMLIPVFIVYWALNLAFSIISLINSFIVLFTGKYWPTAYQLALGLLRYDTKMRFFFFGLTDKYPGFNLLIDDRFSVNLDYPQYPNRFFAVPLIGILARIVLLIPFFIYQTVISNATLIGALLIGWILVLFKGRYHEAFFELVRDNTRLSLSQMVFMSGLSDSYPSFKISMNHKNIKIALIVIALLFTIFSWVSDFSDKRQQYNNFQQNDSYQYNQSDKLEFE